MSSVAFSGRVIAAVAALSLVATPALAASQARPVATIDPMVALSLLGSAASRDALCGIAASGAAGAAAAASAASAATTQAGPVQGCVLPITDAPVAVVEPVGPAPVAAIPASRGLSLGLPILLAATAAAILAALTLFGGNDNDRSPLSPS